MNRGSFFDRMIANRSGIGASMRPRFMNRGSLEHRVRHRTLEGSFNEAPIHESGKLHGSAVSGR